MSGATIKVRTSYLSATDTRGSRIRVTWQGGQYTEPYDRAARDARIAAVSNALHVSPDHVVYAGGTPDNSRYVVQCAMPGDNHSDDCLALVGYGSEHLLPLCGFHASNLSASTYVELRNAGVIK